MIFIKMNEQDRKEITPEDVILRLSESHLRPYYAWLRQILGLSSGALTLLVALQGSYIPQHPVGLPLLQWCWCLLALTILSVLVALYGESAIPLAAANELRKIWRDQGYTAIVLYLRNNSTTSPSPIYLCSAQIAICSFALSVVAMMSFAILNLVPPKQEPHVLDHNIVR